MATIRSRHARRGRTGRTAVVSKFARRAAHVHAHHHRRYAGVRGGPRPGPHKHQIRPSKTGRHRRFLGRKKHVGPRAAPGHAIARIRKGRHGHRKFHGRKKSLHKRKVRHGLHRHFKGRHLTHKRRHAAHKRRHLAHRHRHLTHKRHVKPGLHRRFHGRKTTHHKGHIRPVKPKAAPISSSSYLSMF